MARVFGRIGLLSFGGPAAQIALMHRELVDERPWLREEQFLRALSFCMMLPGPEAMQLATYAGWRLRGIAGGLIAGGLFVLPGAVVIAALAWSYLRFGAVPEVQAMLLGVQALVVVLVAQALVKLLSKVGHGREAVLIAALAFLALFAFAVPFPIVVLAAALWGAAKRPEHARHVTPPPLRAALRPTVIFGVLWAAPLVVLWAMQSQALLSLGLFFSRMAVVSFGGAYALLAYMAQEVVATHGWLDATQMMDALGLAETTPGPLILVTQFVGHVAGAAFAGAGGFWIAGALTLWVTFVPCFLWIFAGAPLIDWLEGQPRLNAALRAVTAAVLGVIANLALWFTLHILFATLTPVTWGAASLLVPDWHSISKPALGLIIIAIAVMWRGRLALPMAVLLMAVMGALVAG